MQIEIKEAIIKYKQLLMNIGMFEAQGILWVNGPVLESIKEFLRDLALKMEYKEQLGQKLFAVLEKNKGESYILFHRKNFMKKLILW